jgi:hypothetical protein
MSFTVKGDIQSINAKLVGTPNTVKAIRGVIDSVHAMRLFEAFKCAQIDYDLLKVSGWRERRVFVAGARRYRGDESGSVSMSDRKCRKTSWL